MTYVVNMFKVMRHDMIHSLYHSVELLSLRKKSHNASTVTIAS